MSRLCILKLCPVMKNIRTLETLLSRTRFKSGDCFNDATRWSCQRGYAQYSSLLTPRIYPLYRLLDRILNLPVTLSTATKEKHDEYNKKYNRRHRKHLGTVLLGSLGLVVAFCDTSHFKGTCYDHECKKYITLHTSK